ncbi:family 43 glycosylhydrolase [Paenibacillus thiaminolyticus]|uniref:glycoside hydrolase family 43 protein n=1 Tax=Paenibacillus thiaminolyticus TaxID=49283 RepID=UPI001164A692|nr:glycoside hydrolase family 43 protein [Paenibacillus thiaminolyticus]NGP62493.1 family 43 glycosylhydrolase [Paenibacillus thiaminolyticus]
MQTGFRTIKTVTTDQIHVRDPFVFPNKEEGKYYLFGTTFADGCGDIDPVFEVYESSDLRQWTGPYIAFQPPKGFWGVRHYWAPEVFEADGKYYMFATCKGGIGEHRGTGILVADHPAGPYRPHSDGPVTPRDWECLDGTYYEDGEGQRWIVFCHEWTELYEGKIKAIRLTKDLTSSYGEAVTILNAADMEWIRLFGDPRIEKEGYLTDAPFMYRARNGELIMLWSSYSVAGYGDEGFGGYTVAIARSATGTVEGPWSHDKQLLMDRNAGHSSLFRDFNNQLWLCTHYPDTPHGNERALFVQVEELENGLNIVR